MSLHNVFGDVGAGKTAFLMLQLAKLYFERGQEILENSCRIIDEENKKRKTPLKYPDRVPIYCNFKVQIDRKSTRLNSRHSSGSRFPA